MWIYIRIRDILDLSKRMYGTGECTLGTDNNVI